MSSFSTDTQSANSQAVVTPGEAVWLRSMRNSRVQLASGYQKLMEQLDEEFQALDQMHASKITAQNAALRPVPAHAGANKVNNIPAVPRQLREQVARQQKSRVDAAVAAWAGYFGQQAAAA